MAANAARISETGRELHKRVSDLALRLTRMGKHLSATVEAYNGFVGLLESRFLPAARHFRELEAAGPEVVAELAPVETDARRAQAPELLETGPVK